MSRKLRSRRQPEKQIPYAVQGIAIGVIVSLVLIFGAIIIVRFNNQTHIGHALPFGFVLFTTILVVMTYGLWHVELEPEEKAQNQRSLLHDPVIEISTNAEYASEVIRGHKEVQGSCSKMKQVTSRLHKESVKPLLDSSRSVVEHTTRVSDPSYDRDDIFG